ncbi:error-prone DNA polymerase [Fodinicurvata sp. EGI_FJ10296]|uniref:error-prone DNA polymerase n=1 Tax=Fodinicurvata sp. EGI_FJ10296 TaxID=3231908 RepID=UPI0034537F7F
MSAPVYAELQVTSNFSFLEGGSHPEELVLAAAALGLQAVAITDRASLAGVVRAHVAARDHGVRLIVGARLDPVDGPPLVCLPTDRAAYGQLSQLITTGRRRAEKGTCRLTMADIDAARQGQILIAVPPDRTADLAAFETVLADCRDRFGPPLFLAASHRYGGDDAARLFRLNTLSRRLGVPMVATNDILYHHPGRRIVQDVLTCIRHGCTIGNAGWRLAANAERHLKAPAEMSRLFRRYPDAIARTAEIAAACRFSLDELRYEYPEEIMTPGETAQQTLVRTTWEGADRRYDGTVPDGVAERLCYELELIQSLNYAPYFLTVYDIVRYARERGILCQGRGSAANSAVCYVLGITAVDPARADLLFERFVSAERNEPPDIDIDFEHERREEVIQYVYEKYGRDRAGMTATVIHYRPRGAVRDVGKAMGLSLDAVGRLAETIWGWSDDGLDEEAVKRAGLDPGDPTVAMTVDIVRTLIGFPRHLSQHVGGLVISRGPLSELVPIENAAMADRTVIQWDKDDLDALGLMKVDILALGMLSCIRRAFDLIRDHYGRDITLASVPAEEPAVYDMLCHADSLGVFQVESRAQMAMLPRLKPRCFYDLVIEVAIVRPGPIQGDMVHPYLRRRAGEERIDYPEGALRPVLEKTLGIPLFQEQAMKIAIVGAGFTPSEADRLRRAMATFRKNGDIHKFREMMIDGMAARGYDAAFAERCFNQIEGFGTYGFPESHAASFALLVYVSAWIKCFYPDVFAAALLNSQPMGFYAPAQIVRDAREHGVEVRAPDVNASDWDCSLERVPERTAGGSEEEPPGWALRLGLRQIGGFGRSPADRLTAARARGGAFVDPADLWRRADLQAGGLEILAHADAFRSMGMDRRSAYWAVKGLKDKPLPLFDGIADDAPDPSTPALLPVMSRGQHVVDDYAAMSLSLKDHPVGLLRPVLSARGYRQSSDLISCRHGQPFRGAGLVLVRQRPGSARGVLFITIEDETGVANLVVLPPVFEHFRAVILGARLLAVDGRVERPVGVGGASGEVIHVRAERLTDLSSLLGILTEDDIDRHPIWSGAIWSGALARADEVKHPQADRRTARDNDRRGDDGREEPGRREHREVDEVREESRRQRDIGRSLAKPRNFR